MANFNNQFATQKLRQEMSVTGTGASFTPGTGEQMATNKAFKKKVKKEEKDVEPKLAAGNAKVYPKEKWGWKDAPSIPNRPSKGGFIYKQLFEDTLEERTINEALEVGDRVKVVYGSEFYGETGTIDDIIRGFVTVEMDRDGRVYSMHSSDVERIEDEDDESDFFKENKLDIKNIGDFNYRMNTLGLAAQQMRDEQLFNMLAKLRSQKDITSAIDILDIIQSKIENNKNLNKIIKIDALKAIEDIKNDYESVSDYSKYRQDPDYYEKDYQEKGTSDYFQRRSLDENKIHIGTDIKTDSNIYFEPSTGTFSINVIDGLGNRWNKLEVNTIDDVIAKFPAMKWTEKGKAEFGNELNESYSKFKNETKTRGKADQFHQAVRQVRQKVQEINRLFEYVSRLKSELSEGEGGLKYKVHTEKALAKIKEMVAELNQNIKKFK